MQQTGIKHAKKSSCRAYVNKQEIQWATPILSQTVFCGMKTARMFNWNITRKVETHSSR